MTDTFDAGSWMPVPVSLCHFGFMTSDTMDSSDTIIYMCQKAQTVPGKGKETPVGIPCVRPQSDMRCYMLDRCGIELGS